MSGSRSRDKGARAERAVVAWLRENGDIATYRALERFWKSLDVEPGGCWSWRSPDRRGYGRISVGNQRLFAHRFSYVMFVSPIPDGLVVDHLCRNRACVNPAHLEPVTNRENTVRGVAPEITRARHAKVSYCPSGHPYDESNTYWTKKGRSCRACSRRRGNGGVTDAHLCRSCAKRHVGTRYPAGELAPAVDGMVHRSADGVVWLCKLPFSRKVVPQ